MANRMSLIVKAETSDEAIRYVRERMIPLHFNPDWEVRRSNTSPHQWVVGATCAIDYNPSHLLNEWYGEDINHPRDRAYPFGSLLNWNVKEDGDLISVQFSKSELVGLYFLLHDHEGEGHDHLLLRVERVLRDNDVKPARA